MRITKHEHACLNIELDGTHLVVDPGDKIAPFTVESLAAIVVTHEHPDHWDAARIQELLDAHPGTPLFAPATVAAASPRCNATVVSAGDRVTAGPFSLEFFGDKHAVIHRSIPVVDNVGVLVNDLFYYGGDAYTLPGRAVELAAIPAGAPWLKVSEMMDYVLALQPARTFATHDMSLSEWGREMANARMQGAVEEAGGRHHVIGPGDSLEV